jgi:2-polyprenyl-3-methyl-5-hydroxy-6-metoxy-1,4-benzoquinol methylase
MSRSNHIQYIYNWYNNIVSNIDIKNNNNIDNVVNVLSDVLKEKNIENIEYIGVGGSSICFSYTTNVVIKICLLNSVENFINSNYYFKNNSVNILPIIDIIYVYKNFIIYTQHHCYPVENINSKFVFNALEILKKMLLCKVTVVDLYYKNFGMYKNDIFIYDFHETKSIYSKDNYYIIHLFNIFNIYFNKASKKINHSLNDIINHNFFNTITDNCVYSLLLNLNNECFDNAINDILSIQFLLKNNSGKHFNNYQNLSIGENFTVQLHDHTLEKFNYFYFLLENKFINQHENLFILDAGCSIGGIGLKIAQLYPNFTVLLNNINNDEINICSQNIDDLCMTNISIYSDNLKSLDKQFDCTLYFAILHHLLKFEDKFDNIVDMIKYQTKHYTIIEVPLIGDALLNNIINNSNVNYHDTFRYLENKDLFLEKFIPFFDIIMCEKIIYGNGDLNRYVFILKKKLVMNN